MNILHVCAGWQKWNGAANIARMIMDEQRREGHAVSFATWGKVRELRAADEVWVHCGWLPCLWWAALWGRNIRWMPEACYDPVRLGYHGWKKRLVGPIERWCLRRCAKIVATCEAEKRWIEAYLGKRHPPIEVTDIKRFFNLNHGTHGYHGNGVPIGCGSSNVECRMSEAFQSPDTTHILYLGRRHPLKGVEYLEKAVAEVNSNPVNPVNPVQNTSTRSTSSTRLNPSAETGKCGIELRIVSNAFGEEKEKVWNWCDVLVLPTLSDNFGLVIAEALERDKRVITTDGAPAWGANLSRVERVERVEGELWSGYGGRLVYLTGYRDGSDETRVCLLVAALAALSQSHVPILSPLAPHIKGN